MKYYLYGTRSATCREPADGFDCYGSDGLDNWEGTFVIFHRPDDFLPTGSFQPYGERLTPKDWVCIDSAVYFEGNTPYLIFSHFFEDTPDGNMCLLRLSVDLSHAEGEPVRLLSAAEAP